MERLLYNCIGKLCCYRVYHQTRSMNISNGIVSKQYWDKVIFENELEILRYLNSKVTFTPKVINVDNINLIIRLEYCGLSLLNTNYLPYDWEAQIYKIANKMKDLGIYHNDLKMSNLTVYQNTIYLIDFGHASFDFPKPKLNCFKKSSNDYYTLVEKIKKKQTKDNYNTFINI